jgi:hypothetical protein
MILEDLNTAGHLALATEEWGDDLGDAAPISVLVSDLHVEGEGLSLGLNRRMERALALTQIIKKHLGALFADNFLFFEARKPLYRLVEGCYPPLSVHSKDADTQFFQEPAELFAESMWFR